MRESHFLGIPRKTAASCDIPLGRRCLLLSSPSEFDDLLQQAQRPVLGYLIRLTGSLHAAQDLLQSANVTAIAKRSSFASGSNFIAWLRQIAWNRLVDLHRRHLQAQARSVMREGRSVSPKRPWRPWRTIWPAAARARRVTC